MTQEKQAVSKYRDPLRRFTGTPLAADLNIMGRKVRLESNSEALFAGMITLFKCGEGLTSVPPDFVWRLIGERNFGTGPLWPKMAAFSDDGLRYVNLGHRRFFAIDLNAREAIAFLSEESAGDPLGFWSVFAATLFDLTASALGLVQVAAACVSLYGNALLVFGPPRSGKTTSTYLTGKLGLEFESDQASYLDLQPKGLQVWGQFWPAAFRPESARFLPELASSAKSFSYADLTFLCFLQQPFRAPDACVITPMASVFLERGDSVVPHLIPLGSDERKDRLNQCLSFQDDSRFRTQSASALRALAKLPGYRLPYGNDPAVAATFLRSLLEVHNSLEVAP